MGMRNKFAKTLCSIVLAASLSFPITAENPEKYVPKAHTMQGDIKQGEKVAYLTFDDGPSPITSQVLDILKKEDIKATFFVNGRTNEEGIELYKRITKEGHSIGNHTYSHNYAVVYASKDAFISDFKKQEDLLWENLGIKPDIMRFPGGSNNTVHRNYCSDKEIGNIILELEKEGYQYFDWNTSTGDAEKAVTKQKMINGVRAGFQHKVMIVLMHDSWPKKLLPEVLPQIISEIKQKGYEFRKLTKDSYCVHFY